MTQPLLEVNSASLKIGNSLLLEEISLTVKQGEILTIIGPNGAGKTTLLRVALGLLQPTKGSVKRSNDLTIGYMPQKLHLDPTFPLTVKKLLTLACKKTATPILPLLQEVGAAHVINAEMQHLSGGELQRVMLARALVKQPNLLVLDEPVQGVDVHGQIELYNLISNIRNQRNCAVLMVSHDLHLVMASTDQVLCLNRHICCSGTPASVTNDPAFTELFGATAVEAMALYVHDPNHHHNHCKSCEHGANHNG